MTRLKLERLARGFSQHAVAAATHIAQPHVSLIETGRLNPTTEELARLAQLFKVAPHELLKEVVVLQ